MVQGEVAVMMMFQDVPQSGLKPLWWDAADASRSTRILRLNVLLLVRVWSSQLTFYSFHSRVTKRSHCCAGFSFC